MNSCALILQTEVISAYLKWNLAVACVPALWGLVICMINDNVLCKNWVFWFRVPIWTNKIQFQDYFWSNLNKASMCHSLGLWSCLWVIQCQFHSFSIWFCLQFCKVLHLNRAVMERRQFNCAAASPPSIWAIPVQIQAEGKSIPVQLVLVRRRKVFHPPGRKHLLVFEAGGVTCFCRVLNQIILDAVFSLFLSLVSLAILPCAAQRALHTPTCSCTFFYWRYDTVSLLTQTWTGSRTKCVFEQLCY